MLITRVKTSLGEVLLCRASPDRKWNASMSAPSLNQKHIDSFGASGDTIEDAVAAVVRKYARWRGQEHTLAGERSLLAHMETLSWVDTDAAVTEINGKKVGG